MGDNAAINDIINNPRYQGALSSIKGVTQVLDSGFIMFISLIAFFIISAALLKNCVAGAYAAYPIFFDKVNEAKTAAQDKLKGKGPKGIGSIGAFLLGLLPDFKELSDFRDNNVQPRDYFIKAIPQMFAVVMIGVVIYNGYYRDVTAKVAYLGSELIHRFIVNVDPVQVWDQMTNSIGAPTLSSDADNTMKGKFVNAISKDLYSQTVSFYTDIKGVAAKNKLSTAVENWTYSKMNAVSAEYFDDSKWKPTYQLQRVLNNPKLNATPPDKNEAVVKQFAVPISEFQIDSAMHSGESWYYELTCTFQKVHNGVKGAGNVDVSMSVPAERISIINGEKLQITTLGGNYWTIVGTGSCTVNGQSYMLDKTTDGHILVLGLKTVPSTAVFHGLYYIDTQSTTHGVGQTTFKKGSVISFTYTTSAGGSASFNEGQNPPTEAVPAGK